MPVTGLSCSTLGW